MNTALQPGTPEQPLRIGPSKNTTIYISSTHGDNWFPMWLGTDSLTTCVYLRRNELTALRDRLDTVLSETA